MTHIFHLCLLLFTTTICEAQMDRQVFNFANDDILLSGVLNLPQNGTAKGLVIIVHGSGPTNAVQQELHLDVRQSLVNSGYAVYMWDKMGCGKSGGIFNYNQTVQSSANEVIAAINTLQESKIPGSEQVGLWGISRAGWICPLVIDQFKEIKFWISVSGVDGKENFRYLLRKNLRINGLPADSVQLLVKEWEDGVRTTHSGKGYESYLKATQNLRKNSFVRRFYNSETSEEGYYSYQAGFMKEEIDSSTALQVYIPEFEALLSKIKCPVLAIFGEKDRNVDWQKTQQLYQKVLGESKSLSISSFPDCNHNLFQCKTGGFYEFQDDKLPWDRCDGFLTTMTEWLSKIE